MLVLGRRVNQSIVIGENVRVMVTRIDGDKVRLGIEAPPDVSIARGELLRARPEFAADLSADLEASAG